MQNNLNIMTFSQSELYIYHIVASSNAHYYLGSQLFVKRSQYIRVENPFISNLKSLHVLLNESKVEF